MSNVNIKSAIYSVAGRDPSNTLVFSDRKDRVIAVALGERDWPPTAHYAVMSAVARACPAGVDFAMTIGPCWYSELRRPLPLAMMTRARLEGLRVWIDRALETDDAQLGYALGLDGILAVWEAWAVAIAGEIARRATFGEPADPVLDAQFDIGAVGDEVGYLDERAWSTPATDPLHLGCSPAVLIRPAPTSPSYTMFEARCDNCGWATETGRRERTLEYARRHTQTTPCGSSSLYLAMVEYEDGEEVSRIFAPRPALPPAFDSTAGAWASNPAAPRPPRPRDPRVAAPPSPVEPTREERARAMFAQMGTGRDAPSAASNLCLRCQVSPDPRGWSACYECRQIRDQIVR